MADCSRTPQPTSQVSRFAIEGLVNLVGGCCGSTPEHIQAVRAACIVHTPRTVPAQLGDDNSEMRLSGLQVRLTPAAFSSRCCSRLALRLAPRLAPRLRGLLPPRFPPYSPPCSPPAVVAPASFSALLPAYDLSDCPLPSSHSQRGAGSVQAPLCLSQRW